MGTIIHLGPATVIADSHSQKPIYVRGSLPVIIGFFPPFFRLPSYGYGCKSTGTSKGGFNSRPNQVSLRSQVEDEDARSITFYTAADMSVFAQIMATISQ